MKFISVLNNVIAVDRYTTKCNPWFILTQMLLRYVFLLIVLYADKAVETLLDREKLYGRA